MNLIFIKVKSLWVKYEVYFKTSFLYLFSSFFTAVIGIIINPFMAKNLSPEDYAIIGYFNSFTIIVLPILSFSLISYYLRNFYLISEERRPVVRDTILIALIVYGLVALIIVLLIFNIYLKWNNISFEFLPYAILSFVPVYLNVFLTFYLVNCRLKREAKKYSIITILNALLSTSFAIIFVIVCKYGATGRMLATLLASLVIAVYCFIKMFGKLQFEWIVIRDAIKFGWPLTISAILWYFLSGVDRAMLADLNDNYTFGFYNVGVQLAGYFGIFYTAIGQTFEPDIYKSIADNHKSKLLKIIGGVIFLNAIPNIIFIIFAPIIIGLLTYNRYIDSSGFAQILALRNITITFYYSTITIIVGYGFTKSELMIRLCGALLSFLLFKVLISNYGFYGAAWGQVLSFIMLAFISIGFLFYQLKKSRYAKKN